MALQRPNKPSISAATKKKTAGSDLSSTRGSEERHASLPATGRGQKRGRDNDIEKASDPISLNQRRSSSRKRRQTSKALSSPPEPSKGTRGKSKADPSPTPPGKLGKSKASVSPSESQKSTPTKSLPEKSAGSMTPSPSNSLLENRVPPKESPLKKRSSLDDSNIKTSKPSTIPQKSTANHGSGDSPLSSVQDSPPELDPGVRIGRKKGLEACRSSRRERAEARQIKDQPRSTKLTLAGIPIDNTPADLVPFVNKKRQRVKTIDNKIKFTDRTTIQQEETFNLRPAIHINVPDHLKSILVDDWENVTKNLSLVPLPSKPSVNEILTSYFDEEKNKRHLGSPEADLLEEVIAGLKEYFERCVGRILLYRFERQQYLEVYNAVQAGTGEYEGKTMGDIYGAEHLCRLFGKFSFLASPFSDTKHHLPPSPMTSYTKKKQKQKKN